MAARFIGGNARPFSFASRSLGYESKRHFSQIRARIALDVKALFTQMYEQKSFGYVNFVLSQY